MTAVVGPSGAGKSTLSRLLFRFYEPTGGTISIDGQDISRVTQASLRRALGIVPQDTVLFNDTIGYNIGYGKDGATRAEIEAAARGAAIHDFVMELPNGYDTEIGPSGSILSAGQRQRIALARALYGDPKLIVLDEPNSNLDESGDMALVAAIGDMRARGSTVVIVSHRPSILAELDFVLVLNKGTMQSFGPREQVLARFKRPPAPAATAGPAVDRPQGAR